MTNLDPHPSELVCRPVRDGDVEVIQPRAVPLGGIRAMTVRRTLPSRERSFIGAWCFLDHYGPDQVSATGGMRVPPHPHTGLQTVSWLFRGEIEHRDSLGSHQLVVPGEMNLMTAGRGIAHSEVSTPATTVLHGVQLWVALPPDRRTVEPAFEHHDIRSAADGGVTIRVFIGELGGESSPVTTHSRLVGAEISLPSGTSIQLPVDVDFEHGVLVDEGTVEVEGTPVRVGELVALPPGRRRITTRSVDERARVLLLGGAPMNGDLVMWWNFVGGTHEEIADAREEWQSEIGASGASGASGLSGALHHTRFGVVPGYDGPPIPAPPLPGGRLRPRGPSGTARKR
jgi:redox-sensitive bicupin YhaK (pirin superfamily)